MSTSEPLHQPPPGPPPEPPSWRVVLWVLVLLSVLLGAGLVLLGLALRKPDATFAGMVDALERLLLLFLPLVTLAVGFYLGERSVRRG